MQKIVLLVVDTLRKKDMAQDKDIAPFLNSKADKGISLENFYSNAPWTVPAHASIFSGKLPSEHGTTTENIYFQNDNELVDFLNRKSYRSYGVTENTLVSKQTGLDKGFDEFKQTKQDLGGETWKLIWEEDSSFDSRREKYAFFFKKCLFNKDIKSIESFFIHLTDRIFRKADFNSGETDRTLQLAKEYLKKEGKVFTFLNLMSVHAPYTFSNEEREKFLSDFDESEILESSKTLYMEEYFTNGFSTKQLNIREKAYKASISYTDQKIKAFYEEAPEGTVFIVLGDHGELIGEYEKQETRLIGHHLGTFKELIEVPCIIFSKGERLELDINEKGLYSHTDIISIIKSMVSGREVEENKLVRSEYFGRKGFIKQFDLQMPEGHEEIYRRKSYSLINSEAKYDLTTEGEYAWPLKDLTEENQIDVPEELRKKASMFYEWRLD